MTLEIRFTAILARMKRAQKTLPCVEGYVHFRRFLRDYYEAKKRLDPSFSYGAFAKKAGVARSHLKGVMDGKRGLTPDSLKRYVKGLGLSDEDGRYFRFLVEAEQAKGVASRRDVTSRIRKWQTEHRWKPSPAGPQGLTGQWARPLVWTLSKVRGFRPDPGWISARLGGQVTPEEAREALSYLEAQGHLRICGDRAVRSLKKNLLVVGDNADWLRRLYRTALEQQPRKGSMDLGPPHIPNFAGMILTEPMVRRLAHHYNEWMKEVWPARKGKVEGDLYVMLWDLIPLKPTPPASP